MKENYDGFLTDIQKREYLMDQVGFSMEEYHHNSCIKIYDGSETLFYHFDQEGMLVFDTVLVCSGFMFSHTGTQASLINRKDFRLISVDEKPGKIARMDILVSVPVRCIIEQTMKITGNGRLLTGRTAALVVQSKSSPTARVPFHIQATSLTQVHKLFSDDEYADAAQRAAMEG